MGGFRFKNQRLLDHLGRIEDEKKNELSKVIGKINKERAFIERARARRKALLSAPEIQGVPGDQTGLRCMLFGSFEKTSSTARRKIDGMQGELQKARQEFIKARQKRQALEKLKEKKHAEWQAELAYQERKIADDRAGQQYIRMRGE